MEQYNNEEPFIGLTGVIGEIEQMDRLEIEEVMEAIQDWFHETYPDWDVLYIAVPQDPKQREEALLQTLDYFKRDLAWNRKKYYEKYGEKL